MITAFRLTKTKHASLAFTGHGARIAGGRWNPPGAAVVYCSASLALAAFETFVHMGDEGRELEFVSFEVQIPPSLVETLERLPKGWRAATPHDASMRIGAKWVKEQRSAVLCVPSVLVPSEKNYLLNPAHPDFRKVAISRAKKFSFDPRVWK